MNPIVNYHFLTRKPLEMIVVMQKGFALSTGESNTKIFYKTNLPIVNGHRMGYFTFSYFIFLVQIQYILDKCADFIYNKYFWKIK